MNRFSRYGFPFQYYNNSYRRSPPYNFRPPPPEPIIEETPKTENRNKKEFSKTLSQQDNVWLDLFGIKLYFDDVLILSLLFFLYQEEVKDEGLFLALIMLLIS